MIRAFRLGIAAAIFAYGFSVRIAMAQDVAPQGSPLLHLAANDTSEHKASKHKSAKQKKNAKVAKSGKSAKAKPPKHAKKRAGGKTKETGENAANGKEATKPVQLATFGDWGAFSAEDGKGKTCYALAEPKQRAPADLKRDPAYVFISDRPGENIHDEVSIIMGFPMKDGGEAKADVSGDSFDLISKGTNAWIKNPAQEPAFVKALKKSAELVVKATSVKGHTTTDNYSLAGLSQALERVNQECR
jgi:hypothetical protein